MKELKRLLALVLVLVMAACTFTACSKKDSATEVEEAIKEIVNDYYELSGDFKLEDALEYIDEDSDIYEKKKESMDYDALAEGNLSYMGLSSDYKNKAADLWEDLNKEILKSREHEIKGVEVDKDGKSAEVTVEVEIYNYDEVNNNTKADKFKEIFSDMYDGNSYESLVEATNSGSVSQSDYYNYVYAAWESVFEQALDGVSTEKREVTVELELTDDEWKIVDVEE